MKAKKLDELFQNMAPWFEEKIPNHRLQNDVAGRVWFLKAVGYTDKLILSDLREVTDRTDLNEKYVERYLEEDTKKRKGVSALKVEISGLYSFTKSFVQRYKGRIHFYRDDLSQKGKRNMCNVGQAAGLLHTFSENLD